MADTRHPVAAGVNSANTLVPWKRDPLPKSRSAAPGWQGATTEPYWAYAREKQRRQPGCPARELGDGTRFQGTRSGCAPARVRELAPHRPCSHHAIRREAPATLAAGTRSRDHDMAHDKNGQDSQAGTVFVAFIVGAIAGAAVALLWAPAAGAE